MTCVQIIVCINIYNSYLHVYCIGRQYLSGGVRIVYHLCVCVHVCRLRITYSYYNVCAHKCVCISACACVSVCVRACAPVRACVLIRLAITCVFHVQIGARLHMQCGSGVDSMPSLSLVIDSAVYNTRCSERQVRLLLLPIDFGVRSLCTCNFII